MPGNLPGSGTGFAPLRNPQYRWLFASNMAFFYAMQAQMVVRLLIVWEMTGDKAMLGYTSFAVAIPMVVISPFGGVIADRLDRRSLILWGQAFLASNEIILLALLLTGSLQFWHLVVGAFLMGCTFPIIMPSRMAIVVRIVGRDTLGSAMALTSGGMNAMRIVAPAAAGFMVAPLGIGGVYALGVFLYVLAALCMIGVKPAPPPRQGVTESLIEDVRGGVRYVRSHSTLMVLMVFGLLPMFLAMPFQTLLVVFADEVWQVGERGFGVLQGVAGLGGMLGAVVVARRGERPQRLRLMMCSVVAFGSFLLLFSISPSFWIALPLILAANVFAGVFQILNNTAIQLIVPEDVRGRISGFLMMSFGLTPLGTLPMALLAQRVGAPTAVAAASAVVVIGAIVWYAASPVLRGMDRSLHESSEKLRLASELEPEPEPGRSSA
jgi:predicted MFS family arabinose efflux permease